MALRKELSKLDFSDGIIKTLFGRNDAGVSDDIILGSGLQMVGNVLSSTGGGGGGSVTSVNASTSIAGLAFNGGPINAGNPSGTLVLSGIVGVTGGGTGVNILAVGDILVANTTTTFGKLSTPAGQNVLLCNGVGSVAYGKVDLGLHVTSVLGAPNGGTGFGAYTVGSMLYASATNAFSQIPAGTANNQVLTWFGGVPQWLAPTGGGSGTLTNVGLSLPSIFNVTVSPVTGSGGTLTAVLNAQAPNLGFFGPASGGSAIPTFRSMVFADIPGESEDPIGAGTLLLAQSDNRRTKRVTTIGGCVVTVPASGISPGWGTFIYRAPGAGVVSFATTGGSTFEGASTSLASDTTGAYIICRSTGVYYAVGALTTSTGITNIAANTELAQSDGTNLVDSGVFVPTKGNITLGSATLSGDRTITTASSSGGNLIIKSNAASSNIIISRFGQGEQNPYLILGTPNDDDIQPRRITTNGTNGVAGATLYIYASGFAFNNQKLTIGGSSPANATGEMVYLPSTNWLQLRLADFRIFGDTNTVSLNGYNGIIEAGSASQITGAGSGGNLTLKSGAKRGAGLDGNITIDTLTGYLKIANIPTSSAGLPTGQGIVWSNAGVLTRIA